MDRPRPRGGTTETDLPVRFREAVDIEVGEAASGVSHRARPVLAFGSGRSFARRGEQAKHERARRDAPQSPPAGLATRRASVQRRPAWGAWAPRGAPTGRRQLGDPRRKPGREKFNHERRGSRFGARYRLLVRIVRDGAEPRKRPSGG